MMEIVQKFKDHPVPFILSLMLAAFTSGLSVSKSYPHLLGITAASQPTEESNFYIGTISSKKLTDRRLNVLDPEWERECKALATEKLIKIGFTVKNSESVRATRASKDALTLIVLCQSNYNGIAIFGSAPSTKYSELEAQAINLRAKLADAWPEFVITNTSQ